MAMIQVPNEYGYVLLTVTGTFFLGFWHGLRAGPFRKAAGLTYPTPYADSAHLSSASSPETKKQMYLWNCAQRAHANYLENAPFAVAAMLIGGLQYPLTVTGLGLGWSVGRVVYAVGYTDRNKEGGKGRLQGSFFWLFQLGLFATTGLVGYNLITA